MMPRTMPKPSRLDADKLQKVRALILNGATAGERDAARARATAIANAAGMSLNDALAVLDAPATAPSPGNFFAGFDDWCEEREPGWKARKAREKAEREAARMARCREHLKRFGNEAAVFAETADERRLRETLAPLADRRTYSNSPETYVSGYAGWSGGGDMPQALREALGRAMPLPADIVAAWDELAAWKALSDARRDFDPDGEEPIWLRTRCYALEHLLDTMPAASVEGVRTRLAWLAESVNGDFARDEAHDRALVAALQADFDRVMAETAPASASPGNTTATARRKAVRAMLATQAGLSDREIARRCGVAPQTVGNQRRAMSGRK